MTLAQQYYEVDYDQDNAQNKYASSGERKKKSDSVKSFLKTVKGQKILNLAKKLGFKKRGVVELIMLIWPLFDDDEELASVVINLLKQLKGMDGLETLLNLFKSISDKMKDN